MTVPPAGQSCGTCIFYLNGECHFWAPDPLRPNQLTELWPPVQSSDWCGQWGLLPGSSTAPPPTSPPAGQSCSNCIFFLNNECHYSPPKPGIANMLSETWTPVQPTDWCGQWGLLPQTNTGPSRTLLNTLTADNTSPYLDDTTSLTATYPWYEIVVRNLVPTTNANILHMLVHSGGSFISSGYECGFVLGYATSAAVAFLSNTGLAYIVLATEVSNVAADGGLNFIIRVFNPSVTGQKILWEWNGTYYESPHGMHSVSQGVGSWIGGTAAVDGFRLTPSLGDNWVSGTVEVYGNM